MPVLRTYECPECNERFEVLHPRWDAEPPSSCELCGARFDEEEPLQPELPGLNIGGSAVVRSVDKTYKDMERSTPGMTDMRDGVRYGESTAKMMGPADSATLAIAQHLQQTMGISQWSGAGTASTYINPTTSRNPTPAKDKLGLIQQTHAGSNVGQAKPPVRLQPGVDFNSGTGTLRRT